MNYRSLIGAAALVVAWPSVASVQDEIISASDNNAEVLRIPFAPPLDEYQHYILAVTKFEPNKSSKTEFTQRLRFEHTADGFILTVEFLKASKDGRVFDLATAEGLRSFPPEVRPFFGPVAYDLTMDGSIIRVRNWAELQRSIAEFPDLIVRTEGANGQQERELASKAVSPYLSMSAEQAPNVILKGWPSLFGYGGIELEAGAKYEQRGEAPAALLPIAIDVVQTYSLSREKSGGGLRYKLTSTPDSKQAGEAAAAYVTSMSQGLDLTGRANLEKAAATMKSMKVQDSLDAVFSPTYGIVEKAEIVRRMSFDGMGEGGESISVTRIKKGAEAP